MHRKINFKNVACGYIQAEFLPHFQLYINLKLLVLSSTNNKTETKIKNQGLFLKIQSGNDKVFISLQNCSLDFNTAKQCEFRLAIKTLQRPIHKTAMLIM